jgi:hypothetical protein
MIYLNIILSLLFLVLLLMALSNIAANDYAKREHEQMRKYNREINDLSLKIHEEILQELRKGKP